MDASGSHAPELDVRSGVNGRPFRGSHVLPGVRVGVLVYNAVYEGNARDNLDTLLLPEPGFYAAVEVDIEGLTDGG